MSFRCTRVALLTASIITFTSVSVQAEEIVLARGCDFTRFVRLDVVTGSVSEAQRTDFRANFMVRYGYACVNGDGSVVVSDGKVVRRVPGGTEIIDIPGSSGRGYGWPRLDASGALLVYERPRSGGASIVLFDTVNKVVLDINEAIPAYSLTNMAFSANAKAVAYTCSVADFQKVFIVEPNEEGKFAAPVEVDKHEFIHELFLSSSGQRLFYQGTPLKTYVVKRTASRWGEPETVEVPGVSHINWLRDVANDGKTLLASVGNQLALIEDTGVGWSKPAYLPLGGGAKISDDGSVVAVIVPRNHPPPRSLALRYYDLFVMIRREPGVWVTKQVSEPNAPFLGDFLLSGDGRILYWSQLDPSVLSGIPNSAWPLHK